MREKTGKVDCFACEHFYVTWDPAFPRGCRAMGFKGKEMPSEAVLKASGMNCTLYKRKNPGAGAKGGAGGRGGEMSRPGKA